MIKRTIILIATFFTITNLFSQVGNVKIELPDSISIIENLNFSCTEIIDARSNKSNIGLASRGGGYNNYQVVFKNDSINILENTIHDLFPDNEEKPELVFIIRHVVISEYIGTMTQIGYASIGLEFAKHVDTSLYSLGVFYANVTEQNNTIKYTHGDRFISTLKECINQFNQSNWNGKEGILIESLNKSIELDYKNLPPKGVYFDYDQMTRKSPIPYDEIEITQSRTKKYVSYDINFKNEINPAMVQFVCDGKDLYMQADNGVFLKALSYGKYIFFHGKVATAYTMQKQNKVVVNVSTPIGFGVALVGLLILDELDFFDPKEIIQYNRSIKGVVIDTETAEIKFVTNEFLHRITKPYPLMLKEYRKSKREPEDQSKVIIDLNKQF